MRRALLLLTLCLSLTVPAIAQEPGPEPPPLRASLAACEAGPEPGQRFAVFTASMPALAGTERMAIRFDLRERRLGAKRWRPLRAKSFGRWERSKPRRAGFIWTKRVERLKQDFEYRALVRFRWLRADGSVQRERRRSTPVCEQPSQRPDLVVETLGFAPGAEPGTYRYLVTVANAGPTPAGAFTLGMVAGEEEAVREVAGLAAGERTTVELVARRCEAGRPVRVQVDVRGTVKEADESNNRYMELCDGR